MILTNFVTKLRHQCLDEEKKAILEVKQIQTIEKVKMTGLHGRIQEHQELSNQNLKIQKIALLTFSKYIKYSLKLSWSSWAKFVKQQHKKDFHKIYDQASDKILELRTKIQEKTEKISSINEDNEKLKLICLEGAQTAKVK